MLESLSPIVDTRTSTSHYKATYILRWNSALSRLYKMSTFESDMKKFDFNLNILPLRIKDWQNVHKGDIVYMIYEGESKTGIVLRGTIMNEPYTYKDWCTEESESRLIDIHMNQIMHPEKAILPDTKHLEDRWNRDEWKGFQHITLLDRQTAEELDKLFNSYLLENKEQFAVNKNNGVAITDYEID